MAHKLPLADIQFIADFAAYARTRGDEAYNYSDARNCATCQFLRDTGRASVPCVNPIDWRDGECLSGKRNPLPEGLDEALDGSESGGEETFSALADRLEALIAGAPIPERAQ
jgi:hypothetical protein